jgi:hypothetical protein
MLMCFFTGPHHRGVFPDKPDTPLGHRLPPTIRAPRLDMTIRLREAIALNLLVPGAGIEPARPFRGTGF